MDKIIAFFHTYFDWFYITMPDVIDIIEILILSFVIYKIMLWFKSSRAWTLLKGIVVILIIMAISSIFNFNTILYLLKLAFSVGILAIVILFQPEFRRGLEELGRKNFVKSIINHESDKGKLSDKSIYELIRTVTELSANKTGALIVIENQVALGEYIDTGIEIDAKISSQLLVNIFEHNTPLHDGAVIIRDDRVLSATCYLPLSDNMSINKELGTRHRAGIGISEVSDSITIIVSEETGSISIAENGELDRNLDQEGVRKHLQALKIKEKPEDEENTKKNKKKSGKKKNSKNNKNSKNEKNAGKEPMKNERKTVR